MEWISVKDRLPDFGDYVIVRHPNVDGIWMNSFAHYNGIVKGKPLFLGVGKYKCVATHWQPEPNPPKEE